MRFFFVLFEFQFEFEGFGRKCNGMHRINGRKCNGMHRTDFGKRILAIVIKSLFGHCGKVAKSESLGGVWLSEFSGGKVSTVKHKRLEDTL